MAWVPNPDSLQAIVAVIHESISTDTAAQRNIVQKFGLHARSPEYIAYLAFILSSLSTQEDRVRAIAGFLLKNNADSILLAPPNVSDYVKHTILHTFTTDHSDMVRGSAQQAILKILGKLGPNMWPACLEHLVRMLESTEADLQQAGIRTLRNVCEDFSALLDFEFAGRRPLNYMISTFIQLSEHPSPIIRSQAVASLSFLLECPSFAIHFEDFFASLSKRTADGDASVRRSLCQALVLLLTTKPDKFLPQASKFGEFMLHTLKDQDPAVALDCCEFWLAFAEDKEKAPLLESLLETLVPLLLDCMVYGEEELLYQSDVGDTSALGKEPDIMPRHYGGGHFKHDSETGTPDPKSGIETYGEELADSDDDSDDSEDFADALSSNWDLRKCASSTLEALGLRFRARLVPHLLHPLKEKLWSNDWVHKESGILALGAVSQGCLSAMEPHLSVLIPYLINVLRESPQALLRSISCWTLERYASWCVRNTTEEHKQTYFVPALEVLLQAILEEDKKVQKAACSAFATLEEEAGPELAPFAEPVLRNLVLAFDKYQQANMPYLYDVMGAFADAIGSALHHSSYINVLIVPLAKCWSTLADDDDNLLPLLGCLTSVVSATGPAFQQFADPVSGRCCNVIQTCLLQFQEWQQDPELDQPDEAFLLYAIDLLSSLTRSLGSNMGAFIASSDYRLLHLSITCLRHTQESVRQSAGSLVDDMIDNCLATLRPAVGVIVQDCISKLVPQSGSKSGSDAIGAARRAGKIAVKCGANDPDFQPFVHPLVLALGRVLLNTNGPHRLQKNVAVCIGRIGAMHPQFVAPYLGSFVQAWCKILSELVPKDKEALKEKEAAFNGLCTLLRTNPSAVGTAQDLFWLCHAIVQWRQPPENLKQRIFTLLQSLKCRNPSEWVLNVSSFPHATRSLLQQQYNA